MNEKKLYDALARCVGILENCRIQFGCCCCGESYEDHPSDTCNKYVDWGEFEADSAIKQAKIAMGEDVEPEMIPFGIDHVA